VQGICREKRPEWREAEVGGGHWVACHLIQR